MFQGPVFDNFVEANGMLLTAHTMPAGSGWTLLDPTYPGTIQSDEAVFATLSTGGSQLGLAYTDCGSADGTVSLTGLIALTGGFSHNFGIIFRFTDVNNYWVVEVDGMSQASPGITIYRKWSQESLHHEALSLPLLRRGKITQWPSLWRGHR